MHSDFFRVLTNIRTLRACCREVELRALEEGLEKLKLVVQERQENLEQHLKAQLDRELLLQKYRGLLSEDGITPDELISAPTAQVKRSKRSPRPAKYEFYDHDVKKTWTGQGRTPAALKRQLEEGSLKLKDFLIQE